MSNDCGRATVAGKGSRRSASAWAGTLRAIMTVAGSLPARRAGRSRGLISSAHSRSLDRRQPVNATTPPLEKTALLEQHSITEEELEKSTLDWGVLCDIYKHYVPREHEFLSAGSPIAETLRHLPQVHSVKLRIKDPLHLIAKIIRKQLDHLDDATLPTYTDCTAETYDSRLKDLIGIRALHLFKQQWFEIHTAIETTWKARDKPTAYYREGDDTSIFQKAGCETEPHDYKYRSVHYSIETSPTKRTYIAELQVRTIFEEAWSEIDHTVRYPNQSHDPSLESFLSVFNRVAGLADEMGSLASLIRAREQGQSEKMAAAEKETKRLLSELKVGKEQRDALEKSINELTRRSSAVYSATSVVSVFDPLTSPLVLAGSYNFTPTYIARADAGLIVDTKLGLPTYQVTIPSTSAAVTIPKSGNTSKKPDKAGTQEPASAPTKPENKAPDTPPSK